jgi:hypothetical protein
MAKSETPTVAELAEELARLREEVRALQAGALSLDCPCGAVAIGKANPFVVGRQVYCHSGHYNLFGRDS